MSELKFTPGPWSIEKSEYPDGAGYYYINAKDKNIGGDVIVFQGIDNMANAKLIKKSPDMIEFICDIVSACNYGTEQLSPSFLERAEKIICETIGENE